MRANEAAGYLEDMLAEGVIVGDVCVSLDDEDEEAVRTAISALEEVKRYMAIGTVEEFRAYRGARDMSAGDAETKSSFLILTGHTAGGAVRSWRWRTSKGA